MFLVPPKPDVHRTSTSTGLARNWNCKQSDQNYPLAGGQYLSTFAERALKSVNGIEFGQFSSETLGLGTLPLVVISEIGRRTPHVSYDSRDRMNVSHNFSGLFIATEWRSLALRAPLGEFQSEFGRVKPGSAIGFF